MSVPMSKHWILYDGRACGDSDSDSAVILVSCESDEEARSYAGDYGDMACYLYDQATRTDTWQWDWLVDGGFSDSERV